MRWCYQHLLMVFIIFTVGVISAYIYFIPILKDDTFIFEYGSTIPTKTGYYFYEVKAHDIDLSNAVDGLSTALGRHEVTLDYGPYHYDVTIVIEDTIAPSLTLIGSSIKDLDDLSSIIKVDEINDYQLIIDEVVDLTDTLDYQTNGLKYMALSIHAVDSAGNASETIDAMVWVGDVESMVLTSGYVDETTSLSKAIENYVSDHGYTMDDLSYGYTNLMNGETILYDASNWRIAASTYKLPMNMIVMDRIHDGTMDYDDQIIFEPDDYEESAGNLLDDYDLYDPIPLDYLMHESLYYSSNTASRMIYKALGGFTTFKQFTRKYSDVDYASTGEDNRINVDFLMDVILYFYDHMDDYPLISQWLSQAVTTDYASYYLDLPMIHKYGHYQNHINDVGLTMGPYPFAFVVLSDDMETYDLGMIVNIMAEYTMVQSGK